MPRFRTRIHGIRITSTGGELDGREENKRIYRRGKKDGIVEGIKQGIMEKSIEIAKKLLKENFSKEKVASITGLSEAEIENIK